MKIYLQFIDFDFWLCILNVPHTPKKRLGKVVLKTEKECFIEDKKKTFINIRTMNILYFAFKKK